MRLRRNGRDARKAPLEMSRRFATALGMIASLLFRLNFLGMVICLVLALPFWSLPLLKWAGICGFSAMVWWLISVLPLLLSVRKTDVSPNRNDR